MKNWVKILIAALVIVAGVIGAIIAQGPAQKQVSLSLTVLTSGDFAITVDPTAITVTKGTAALYNITVVPSGGFDANVRLSLSGLPDGSWQFTRNPLTPGAWTSQLQVNTSLLTTNSTYAMTLTADDI